MAKKKKHGSDIRTKRGNCRLDLDISLGEFLRNVHAVMDEYGDQNFIAEFQDHQIGDGKVQIGFVMRRSG